MLEGRVCIITGAGRGIGREHALLFAEQVTTDGRWEVDRLAEALASLPRKIEVNNQMHALASAAASGP